MDRQFQHRVYKYGNNCCTQPFPGNRVCFEEPGPPILFCTPSVVPLACNQALPAPNPAAIPVTVQCDLGIREVEHVGDVLTSTVGCVETWTRTYRATDRCGGVATCTQTFTRKVDRTPPVFTACPAGADLGCNPTTFPAAGTATATDNCLDATPTISVGALGAAVNVGGCNWTRTRIYTATDACGNTATCSQVYTYTVVTAPVLAGVPANANLGCNPTSLPVCATTVTASNQCGPVTVTCTPGAITTTGCTRTQIFTYTATACGLTASATTTYTWTVVTAPVLAGVPANADLGCNPTTLPVCATTVTASNQCGPVTVSCTPGTITTTGCTRTQIFTYTATACGLTASATTTYTWTVVTAPVLAGVPANANLGCNPTTLPVCATTVTASNQCGPVTVTCTPGAITTTGCTRTQIFTYTATACGLTASATTTYTWTVVTAPVLAGVPANANLGCNPTTLPVCATTVTASNQCGSVAVSCTPGAITTTGCTRTQIFTYTATACGLTASATTTYTWTVVTAPVLAGVPANANLGCNPTTLPVCATTVTASNQCGSVAVSCTPGAITTTGCTRTQIFTYTATACGLTASATTTYTWTVVTAPVLAGVPANANLGCNPTTLPVCATTVTASNQCGPVTVICTPGTITSNGCGRSQIFTYTATACGLTASATATYTWTVDITPPMISLADATGLGCNPTRAQVEAAFGGATVTDNCNTGLTATGTVGPATGTGCTRTVIKSWTAVDACGNTGTASQSVTYNFDETKPVITVTPSTQVSCNPTEAQVLAAFGTATVTDNCTEGGPLPGNPCVASYKGNNGGGNCPDLLGSPATGTVTLTFTSAVTTAPTIVTVTDQFGTPSLATVRFGPGVLSDGGLSATYCYYDGPNNNNNLWGGGIVLTFNLRYANGQGCGGTQGGPLVPQISTGPEVPGIGCLRSRTRTWTATDNCGNTQTFQQVVSYTVDVTKPVFTFCPANANLGCNPTEFPSATPTATDNCGTMVTITGGTLGAAVNTQGCTWTRTRTWTATDACGNTETCTQVLTYTVVTAPVLAGVPANTNLGCNPTTLPVCATTVTASNQCGPVTVSCTPGTITTTGCTRTQIFTYTATACGLTASATTTYTWTVVTAPVLAGVPANANLGCNPTSLPVCATTVTASNQCGPVTVSCTPGAITTTGCTRTQIFTYTATACGLTASATTTYTWTVVTAPVLAGVPANANLGCNPTTLPVCATTVTASNQCGSVAVSCTPGAITTTGCTRTQIFTYTATACGLTASATTTYTWTVVTAPVLAGVPANANLGCNPTTLPVCATTVTASNQCGSVAVSCTPGAITTTGCTRTQIFTYTATACGLTASATTTYTWTVVTAPVLAGVPANANLGCNPTTLPVCATTVTASNQCGSVAVSCTPGAITTTGCTRTQIFTYTATACGLTASATTTYTWTVVTAPVLAGVPANANLGCNPTTLPVCATTVTASNQCGSVAVSCTPGAITTTGCTRTQIFTYTATACGLTASATTTYTWTVDLAGPTVSNGAPAAIEAMCTATFGTLPWVAPIFTDVCGAVTLLTDVTTPDQEITTCPKVYVRVWTVRDACGNTSSFRQTITVPCCEGCSPGFWKNHTELWNQSIDYPVAQMPALLKFTTSTNFNDYFNLPAGTNGFDNSLTMEGAIGQGGGDCKAFARHAVAALLSSASGLNIGYPTGTSNFTSLYNAIRTALLSGNCSGTLFSQLEAISDGDHTNCGQFDNIITMNNVVSPERQATVSAYPNPFTDRVVFTIKSTISGNASFELYNLLGQKVTTLYQGAIEKEGGKNLDLRSSS